MAELFFLRNKRISIRSVEYFAIKMTPEEVVFGLQDNRTLIS